jgi:hypothetical protein
MPSAGFEPATPATKRTQTYALDRASTEVGIYLLAFSSDSFCLYDSYRVQSYNVTVAMHGCETQFLTKGGIEIGCLDGRDKIKEKLREN